MKSLPEGTESTMSAKEPTPPPDGVGAMNEFEHVGTVDESGQSVPMPAYGFPPIPKEPVPLDRIATALERLVELAEQGERLKQREPTPPCPNCGSTHRVQPTTSACAACGRVIEDEVMQDLTAPTK